MNKYVIVFALSILSFSFASLLKDAKEAHWAVLVAGSNGWWNYRHQSDTCHTYQLLIKNGIPASRIIHLAYDDIANDYSNPFPGKIFNKPDPTGKGVDVYAGCKIDYTSEDVTPEVFINVLKGDEEGNKGKGTGRVLKSTSNDKVFVYFTDHGATGLIAFPSSELFAEDLIATLKFMHDNNLYKRLVFYLEACESGSMFDQLLPNNWEIYATTAANPHQSSWATYCSPEDKIDGKSVGSCLGDEYSVNWMEDSEAAEHGKHLQHQFEDVRDKTKGSQVQQYGVLDWTDESIHNYQGDVAEFSLFDKFYNKIGKCANKLHLFFSQHKAAEIKKYRKYLDETAKKSRVDSRDVKLHYLIHKVQQDNSKTNVDLLTKELEYRKSVDHFFTKFNERFAINGYEHTVNSFECLKSTVKTFKNHCTSLWDEYTLKYVKSLNTACNATNTETVTRDLLHHCS